MTLALVTMATTLGSNALIIRMSKTITQGQITLVMEATAPIIITPEATSTIMRIPVLPQVEIQITTIRAPAMITIRAHMIPTVPLRSLQTQALILISFPSSRPIPNPLETLATTMSPVKSCLNPEELAPASLTQLFHPFQNFKSLNHPIN